MKPTERTIADMFDRISGRYDLLNHLLSGYTDVRWRKKVVQLSLGRETKMVLDVSTGTGDMAAGYSRAGAGTHVYGLDISMEMLRIAKKKYGRGIHSIRGSALSLPFKDNMFNLVSCAFGIRNIYPWEGGLKEFYRVLKPGGRAAILEFSMPHGVFGRPYRVYFEKVLPWIGNLLSGTGAYSYLRSSVKAFPQPNIFRDMLTAAGFKGITITHLTHGIATIYLCNKEK
jgi:demethylmenaquinone methyltransferase / 2-methoxy-6-polyprenyl-1,4-benzoquinol methylase